jgi:anti-sigma factor RsiW
MIDNFDGEQAGAVLDERFELLSAYLDGEVTASERRQVETLLATDREFQQQYRQMQHIHVALPQIKVPCCQSVEALTAGVFGRIDRHNRKLSWIGSGAIAATLIATITGLGGLFDNNNSQLQFAANKANTPAPLMVALNDPIMEIPDKSGIELPMSSPEVNAD